MDISLLFKGAVIGFAMAIPIGPIGIICVRKTLTDGRLRGIAIGFGAATADLLFSCIAAFGLTIISSTIDSQKLWIRIIGGIVLFYLGVRTFRARPAASDISIQNNGILRSYFSTIILTLTNPFTVFAFIAVFAALGFGKGLSYYSASALVTGVFIGSSLWFLSLSSGVTFFRKKMNLNGLLWVNRVAGVLIIISGVISIGSLL